MRAIRAVAVILALSVAACETQAHNDVLVFGTNTKLALDVGVNPATGGTPEITVGYKRQEAVWMPLVINGAGISDKVLQRGCIDAGGAPASCQAGISGLKYQGQAERAAGGQGMDAYSVFASFGANLKGDAKSSGAQAAVGLAQFFATGVAAQRLASNSQVVSALSLQGDKAGEVAEAAAKAVAPEDPAITVAKAEAIIRARESRTTGEKLAACKTLKGAKLSTLLPASAPSALYDRFKADLDKASNVEQLTSVVATWKPDFQLELNALLTTCGVATS